MTLKPPPRIHGLNFSADDIDVARKSNSILQLSILVDCECNFDCPYCFTRDIRKNGNAVESLTLSDYKSAFKEAKDLNARSVLWLGNGEPLLYDAFWELIDASNDLGLSMIFFTNGSLITAEIAKRLVQKDVSIFIKLNSFDACVQDEMVGIPGANSVMKEGLLNLMNAGFNSTSPSRLGIQSVIDKQNYTEILSIYKWARLNNVVPFIEMILPLKGVDSSYFVKYDISLVDTKSLFYQLLAIDETEFSFTWVPTPPYVGEQCNRFYYSLCIDSSGIVRPCGGSGLTLGNLNRESLSSILLTPLVNKIRTMKEYLEGKCHACIFSCCGCREEAYLTTGNFFGSYERCWHPQQII